MASAGDGCGGRFDLFVSKAACKFNAAHFIAHADGTRERLHGHNYRAEAFIRGRDGHDVAESGYLLDFGAVKAALKHVCKSLDEKFLCPASNPALKVEELVEGIASPSLRLGSTDDSAQLKITVRHDGAIFQMPRADAVVLPIAQASAELLARHLCVEVLEQLGGSATLWSKGAAALTVGVVETPHQEARYTVPLAPRD